MPRPPYPHFPKPPTPEVITALFAQQRAADPFGMRLHTAAACACLFFAGWPTTYIEWSALVLLLVFLVRQWTHHRALGPLFWDPLARLAVAWVLWMTLTLAWTPGGMKSWLHDGQSLRFVLLIPLLYPVLDRTRLLTLSLIAGLLCGQFSQLIHAVSVWSGHPAAIFNRDPARLTGWWDPVIAGSLLTAALGLFCGIGIPADVHSDGLNARRNEAFRSRPILFILIALTLLCILATGTRGAWIASALLLLITAALSLARFRLTSIRSVSIAAAMCIALAAGAWFALPSLRTRAHQGINEVHAAITTEDYKSDTGLRLAMWLWSWDAIKTHPIRGVGAGGLRSWAEQQVEQYKLDRKQARQSGQPAPPEPPPLPHYHAHSWPLHTLATLGLVGFGLMAAMLIIAIRNGSTATSLALLGLSLAGLFDTIHVNQQTANLLFILFALSLPTRPPKQ